MPKVLEFGQLARYRRNRCGTAQYLYKQVKVTMHFLKQNWHLSNASSAKPILGSDGKSRFFDRILWLRMKNSRISALRSLGVDTNGDSS
jgi:hypothetical protein